MGNLAPDDDAAGQTEPIDPTMPQPARHGQVHVSDAHGDPASLTKQLNAHLAEHQRHLATTAAYHRPTVTGPGDTGQSSGGGFTGSGMQGGASGSAEYSTTNEGAVGDADSGPSGY